MAWMCEKILAEFNNSDGKKIIKDLTPRTGISKSKYYYEYLNLVHSLFVKYIIWETRNFKPQV